MKILLIKPETVGIFCYTNQVEHEPLEMEYLKALFDSIGYEAEIYDRRYDLTPMIRKLKEYRPDVVCITGYITQQKLMIKYTHIIKKFNPNIQIIIGGSNAEINYVNYYESEADYIYHLSGLENLRRLVQYIEAEKAGKVITINDIDESGEKPGCDSQELTPANIDGICYRDNGEWKVNKKVAESPEDLPRPDRSFFYKNIKRFGYLKFRPLALVKNSYSCRKSCKFCFCTNRNSGRYACRSVEDLVDEIKSLEVPNIHITDDDFLVDRDYLTEFVRLIRVNDIHKKFLIYGRADFVAENEDIIAELADVGLALVMVGLEATNDNELDSYNKRTSVHQNEECVRILSKYGIICAGLFIVHQGMQKQDFKNLYNWIAKRDIIPTISIFTPMQGSAIYREYEDKIVDKDTTKQDLFHCLIEPEHMSIRKFTREYYKLSMSIAFKKRHADLYSKINYFGAMWHVIKVTFIKFRRLFVF